MIGWEGRVRTCDPRVQSPLFYRLNYLPKGGSGCGIRTRDDPDESRVTSATCQTRQRWSGREDSNLRKPDPKSGSQPLAHVQRWLRRSDSNRRPQGYEPRDLPLIYVASKLTAAAEPTAAATCTLAPPQRHEDADLRGLMPFQCAHAWRTGTRPARHVAVEAEGVASLAGSRVIKDSLRRAQERAGFAIIHGGRDRRFVRQRALVLLQATVAVGVAPRFDIGKMAQDRGSLFVAGHIVDFQHAHGLLSAEQSIP